MSSDISGVSRSGRVRKKSAKLKEMEEIEKNDGNTSVKLNNSKESNSSFMSNGSNVGSISSSELDTPKKSKKLKIKFSSLENGVEEVPIDNEFDQSDLESSNLNNKHELTVPSLKIKLFQNSNDNYCTSPTKKKSSSSKKLYSDNENAANLLFQQITSGHVNDNKKKYKKKVYNDPEENVLFDPNDESYSEEETSLVISDSNESLQALQDYAKSIKNPNRRLTETKIDYKFGVMKVKKIDVKPRSDKKQKLSKITAYTLFARENRSRIQQSYPQLDFANISKRLGEVWQALPQREKMQWKRKAQKQKGVSTGIKTVNDHKSIVQKPQTPTLSQLKQQLPIRYGGVSINHGRNKQQLEIKVNLNSKTELFDDKQIRDYLEEQQTRQPIITNTVDIASYLHILGESLNSISTKLNNLNQQNNKEQQNFNDQYALDVLLDSAICAMSPLICLTNNARPELKNCCDEKTQKQLLDNVAFLMPGI